MNHVIQPIRSDRRALALTVSVFAYCYAIRWLLIAWDPALVAWTMPEAALDAVMDPRALRQALHMSSLFAFGFVTMAMIQLLLPRADRLVSSRSAGWMPLQLACACLLLSVILYAGIALGLQRLGIGVQGQLPLTALPFKLAGLLIYLKSAVLPAFILAVVYLMDRRGHAFWSRMGALSLVFLGVMDMLLFDTRSSALRAVVLLALLWWIGKLRLRTGDKAMLAIAMLVLPILIAMVTQKRLFGETMDMTLFAQIEEGVLFLMFRITGVEHLAVIAHLSPPLPLLEAWEMLTSERGVSGYYTVALLDTDPLLPQTFAPSGLGWLYLVGGPLLVFAGGLVMGWAALGLYALLARPLRVLAPVAKAFYLLTLVSVLSEGAMQMPITSFLIGYATLLFIEAFLLVHRKPAFVTPSSTFHDTPSYRFV